MLTGKQRAHLKGIANTMDPLFQLGKGGITENFLKQIDVALETREVVKIKILKNNLLDPTEVAREIANELKAEFVQSMGSKFVIYRESKENKKIELPK